MLNQQTVEKLHGMKLHGMADSFRAQLETTQNGQLSFEERFALLVDQQWLWKENRALARRLQTARLKERGVMEDIDYQHPRGLDRKLVRTLATSEWVTQHQNILLLGPTGIGKSWLACALAQKACRDGFSVSGKLRWEVKLEANGHTSPTTYMGRDRRQYVALMASGGFSPRVSSSGVSTLR